MLEFTSDRKRMSVVVKDTRDGKIILLSKGADEAMLPCASYGILFGYCCLPNLHTSYDVFQDNTIKYMRCLIDMP